MDYFTKLSEAYIVSDHGAKTVAMVLMSQFFLGLEYLARFITMKGKTLNRESSSSVALSQECTRLVQHLRIANMVV